MTEIAAAAAAALAAASGAAAQAPPENVRGRLVELTESSISVEVAPGKRLDMRLAPEWSVQVMRPIRLEDVQPGRFVGVIEQPQPEGYGLAREVHMFLPGVRMGEGQQPWDRPPGSTMTQGDIGPLSDTPQGKTFELSYAGGKRRIVAPKGVPVVLINNEGRENIKVGVEVFILAWPEADGRRRVDAVATGEGGALPPL
ncbi:hypothetical protein LJR164_004440 [Phenylobacterium sp. LjRoot164]|uniref:hypothetical protein n=1 Tax=unclassified Phenylobacterium TaxID=2640670 RepID=UPI003ECD1655